MPHLTVEYSANLETDIDIESLLRVLHETACNIEAFPMPGIRTRAVARKHYEIADGHPDNGFVSLMLRIAPGRPFDVRKAAGETVFAALCNYLEPIYSSKPLAISFEMQELDGEFRWKKNNLRDYIAKRTTEH
jgi:5-carboxymethyl-2-hydroxymuconate isomerase